MQHIEFFVVDRLNPDITTRVKNIDWPFDDLPMKNDFIYNKDDSIFTVRSRTFNIRDSIVKIFMEE